MQFLPPSRAIAHFGSANCPAAYQGLKIITSLSLRFPDFQRGKTVVVTHHAPTSWSWNDSPNAIKRLAYCNDLKSLFHDHQISAWFHGHTHSIADYRIEESRILANTRGYVGHKEVPGFDLNKIAII